ncbi:unnamed protein product [Prorocentrum cordatum]|uniref:Amino acid transporter transmembrane domain-containing protein n=1 Tax=Prorocentrum cordatum TaxID=2364126 RepID=A0ABN9SMI3_9DINO|nr:unnamed protein product [Polarella glacialis]
MAAAAASRVAGGSCSAEAGPTEPLCHESEKVKASGWLARTLRPMGEGSLRGSVLTLMSASIGPGSLLLPYMFRLLGVPMGVACIAFGTYCGAQSLRLIMTVAHLTRCDSYSAGVACLLGPLAGNVLSAVLSVTMVLATGTHLKFLAGLLPCLLPDASTARFTAIALVFPLCAVRDVGALRYAAMVGPVFLVYVTVLLVVRAALPGAAGADAATALSPAGAAAGPSSWEALSELPRAWSIVLNALTCHHVAVPVFRQLHRARAQRVNKMILRSVTFMSSMYTLIGLAGFASQGADTPENILLAFPATDSAAALGQALVGCILMVSIPLCVASLRVQVQHLFPPELARSPTGHAAITVLLLLLPTGIGAFFPNVTSMLGVACGFGMAFYIFVVPSVCVVALRWRPGAHPPGGAPPCGPGGGGPLQETSCCPPPSRRPCWAAAW